MNAHFGIRSPLRLPPDREHWNRSHHASPEHPAINIGGIHHVTDANRPSSDVLFMNGSEQSWHENQLKKQIALEKWDATMAIIAGGQTKDAIRWRQIIGQDNSHTRSKTEFERSAIPDLERHLEILLALEQRIKQHEPKTEEALETCIQLAREDVDHPGTNLTIVEAMQARRPNGTKSRLRPHL